MRVLLTNLPPLLRDILSEALAGESDIAMVGGAPSADLGTLVRDLSPDVVLAQASKDVAADHRSLSRVRTAVGLVAIDPDSRHAYVYGRGEAPVGAVRRLANDDHYGDSVERTSLTRVILRREPWRSSCGAPSESEGRRKDRCPARAVNPNYETIRYWQKRFDAEVRRAGIYAVA